MFKQFDLRRRIASVVGASLLVIGITFGGSERAEAATLTISETDVKVGDVFDITLNLERLETIGAISATISGDEAKVQATARTPGSVFSGLTFGTDFLILSESVGAASYSFGFLFAANQTGPVDFMTVTFKALMEGNTTISLAGVAAPAGSSDPVAIDAPSLNFNISAVDTGGGGGVMTPVPLPASGLLLAAVLAAGVLHGRRRAS